MSSRASSALLLALAFASGAAALAYEVVFFRALGLAFGVSSHSVAAVVGAFLFGLGLGAWLGGRIGERWSALRAYAAAELGIALFGVLSPQLFRRLRELVELQRIDLGSPLVGVLESFVVLAWPTVLMGATFPLLGRAIASFGDGARVSTRVGWLYGVNTLGACAGALLAAFVLLPEFGLSGASRVAAGVNVALAIASLGLERVAKRREVAASPAPRSSNSSPRSSLLVSVALLGFAALALQVLANRLIVSVLGGTVYVFSAVVAVFLLGIALGGACGGRAAERSASPLRTLALLAGGFAASVGLGMGLLALRAGGEDVLAGPDNIALLAPGETLSEFSPLRYLRATFGLSCIALLPATFLSGAFFAAALHVARSASEGLGATLGRVYAWNTAGSIAGSIAASFVLLPVLGLRGGMIVAAVASLAAAAVLWRDARSEPAERGWTVALVLALVASVFGLVPRDPPGTADGLRTVFHAESAASAAKVQEFEDAAESTPIRNLRVNGKTVASSIFIDRRLQYLLGCVSVLAHREPRSMLCIGLGTGMTPAAMAVAGGDLTVVEISPAVIEAARRFERWNERLHERDDVSIVCDDGRAWLARSERRFDVISADPIDPCVCGSAYLYTEEYYRLGRARLADGGLMSQWIPLYDLAPSDIAGIVLTFQRVFPNATAWVTGYDMMLVGGVEPLALDPAEIEERMEVPRLRALLADVGIESADELLGCCFAGPNALQRLGATANRPNTDEDPWIEFHAPLASFGTYPLEIYRVLASGDDLPPLSENVGSSVRRSVAAHRARLQRGAREFVANIESGQGYGRSRNLYIEFLRAE